MSVYFKEYRRTLLHSSGRTSAPNFILNLNTCSHRFLGDRSLIYSKFSPILLKVYCIFSPTFKMYVVENSEDAWSNNSVKFNFAGVFRIRKRDGGFLIGTR